MLDVHLNYFEPGEFGKWWPLMCRDLLSCADRFRFLWGAPVRISPHPDALGRELPASKKTLHNVKKWKKVRAMDFFPEGMDTPADMKRAFECAKMAGFSGIGLYTDTKINGKVKFMMHGDNRPDRTNFDPATWSRVNGKYLAIEEVF